MRGPPRLQPQPQVLREEDGGAPRHRIRRHHRASGQHQPGPRPADAEGGRQGHGGRLSRLRQHQPPPPHDARGQHQVSRLRLG